MDDNPKHPQPADEPPHIESVGERLRRKRELMGLSLEDVAKQLHLEMNVLQALETDDFESLPWPAYIKGYIRAYSQLLGMESRVLIEDYQHLSRPPEPELKPTVSTTRDHMTMRGRMYAIGSAVALLLVLVAAWWYTHTQNPVVKSTAETNPANATGSQPTAASPLSSTLGRVPPDKKPASTAKSTISTTQALPLSTSLPRVESVKPAATPQTPKSVTVHPNNPEEPVSEPVAGQTTLTLRLSHRSWVQIDDANGKRLAYGLMDAGMQKELTGVAPFSVFLGYAQGVQLSIDGHHFKIAPFIRSNHTARFMVQAPAGTGKQNSP